MKVSPLTRKIFKIILGAELCIAFIIYLIDMCIDYANDILSGKYRPNKIVFYKEDLPVQIAAVVGFILLIIIIIYYNKYFKKYHFKMTGYKYYYRPKGIKCNIKKFNFFRDIPCNKDIFKVYFLSQYYHLNEKHVDLIGALLLNW